MKTSNLPSARAPLTDGGQPPTRPWYNFFRNINTESNAGIQAEIYVISQKLGSPDGTVENIPPIASGGTIVGSLSVTSAGSLPGVVTISLHGDTTPTATQYYGTDTSSTRGWYNVADALGACALANLGDVDATPPTDTYVLTWDAASSKWKPAPGGAGGSPLTTKGDLYGYSTTGDRFPVGANGLSVVADSTQTTGLKYAQRVASVVAGSNVTVDNTDPLNPVVSATGGSGGGGGGGGGSFPWTPSNMVNYPQIWLDADTPDMTVSSGVISTVVNRTSAQYNFRATSSNRPTLITAGINGKNVIRFNGTSHALYCGDFSKNMFNDLGVSWGFAVVKKSAIDSSAVLRRVFNGGTWSGSTVSTLGCGFSTKNNVVYSGRTITSDAAYTWETGFTFDTSWHMIFFAYSFVSGAVTMWVDGQVYASTTSTLPKSLSSAVGLSDPPCIGAYLANGVASQFMDMDLAAYVGSNSDIPRGDDLDRMFGWAAHLYGLTGLLPSGHPYKSAPP